MRLLIRLRPCLTIEVFPHMVSLFIQTDIQIDYVKLCCLKRKNGKQVEKQIYKSHSYVEDLYFHL